MSAEIAGRWTRERPRCDGYYWYREPEGIVLREPCVVWWDTEMQWVQFTGNECAAGDDMRHKITGEFWSEPLRPPDGLFR